jgi:cell division protein FtsL
MTPTALTPAGRGNRPQPRQGTAKRPPAGPGRTTAAVQGARTAARGARTAAQGARAAAEGARTVARSARPPVVSGPAGGRGTGHRAPVRRSTAPRNPRRVSGPVRPDGRGSGGQPVVRAPLAARSASFIRALPDHALLDRIIRGRYWIPLLGVLLVGIVAMQVEVLKLNAGIGSALEQSTSLQNRNEQLRAAVAREADDQRIESMAAHMGMLMPQPAAIRFLQRHPVADIGRAISNIHAPDATGFDAGLATGASATAPAGVGTPSVDTTTSGTAGTSSTDTTISGTAGTSSTDTTTSGTAGTASSGVVPTPSDTGSAATGA